MILRRNEQVDFLASVPLFSNLNKRELTLLARHTDQVPVKAGKVLTEEGAPGREFMIIIEGNATVKRKGKVLARLGPGDFFGELALVDHEPRSADARAHDGGATVLTIDENTLNEILSMDSSAARQFLGLLVGLISRRIREIDEKIISWRYMAGF